MSTGTHTALERILAETRVELERRKRERPLESLRSRLPGGSERLDPRGASGIAGAEGADRERPFRDALERPGVGIVAEFKRRSPSAGSLRRDPRLAEIVAAYERGGAAALSVLTEGPNFDGSLEDLPRARAASSLPVLRKDFIVDSYQVHETLLAGADAVLLIVAALPKRELASLHREARAMGLDALVEVHDRAELHVALELEADIVGINNRDLRDFTVDLERTAQLIGEIPEDVIVVSESGIAGVEHMRRLREARVQAVLVGEAFMRAADPESAVRRLSNF